LKEHYPGHEYERSQPILHRIRGTKSAHELEVMRIAAEVTTQGYKRVLKFLKPGVWEYELEAEFMHEFLTNRSRGFAYTPIIAAGNNANVLHYIENNAQCNDGDLVLFDVGAEYGNYTCDVTRCFPVNGKFTARQKEVYNAVLRVHEGAIALLRPGTLLDVFHKEVGALMTKELLDLGLISAEDVANEDPAWPAYKNTTALRSTTNFILANPQLPRSYWSTVFSRTCTCGKNYYRSGLLLGVYCPLTYPDTEQHPPSDTNTPWRSWQMQFMLLQCTLI
jgi:Xaa-Pro aminopeptidase